MRNREAGNFFPSSEELDADKRTQERHDEQRQREFLDKQKQEQENRLESTDGDRQKIEQQKREEARKANDPVERVLEKDKNRQMTPEEKSAQEARDIEDRRQRREEEKEAGIGLNEQERFARDQKQEAARLERDEEERKSVHGMTTEEIASRPGSYEERMRAGDERRAREERQQKGERDRLTDGDRQEIERQRREEERKANDPVERVLEKHRNRQLTPEEQQAKEARDIEDRRERREDEKRAGIGLNEQERYARDKKQEAARRERWSKQEADERFQNEQAQRNFDRLKEDKAPDEKIQDLVAEKAEFRIDDDTTIDIREAIPALVERLNESADTENSADALEVSLKTMDALAQEALMYGGDYKDSLDRFAADLQQKLFETARKNDIDLATLREGSSEESAEEGQEAEPGWSLDAALSERGKDEWFLRELMALERSSEKKAEYMRQKTEIEGRIAAGADKDDDELRGLIDKFMKDVQRGRDENDL